MNDIYDIYKKTNNFDEPRKFKIDYNPYNIQFIDKVLTGIVESSRNKINKNCRIYIDGNLYNPFKSLEIIKEIVNKKINNVNWDEIFKGREFLFFINFAGEFSEELLNKSKEYFNDNFNDGEYLIEHHVIFGRYSQTSFGIHIDDANDRVIHYNVGNSAKNLYLENYDTYVSKYGEVDMYHDGNVLDKFKKYTIEAGEVFVLPANYYHIGESKEVSFNIVLALTKINNYMRIDEVAKRIQKKYLNKVNYDKSRRNFSFNDDIDDIDDIYSFNSLYKDFLYENISNSSFLEKPKKEFNFDFEKICKSKFIFVRKVYYYKENNIYYFYSNGYKCEIKKDEFKYVDKLLKSKVVDFNKIKLFDKSILSSFALWLLHTKTIKEVV